MNPFLFRLCPAIKDIIWGGTRLSRDFCKAPEITRIAETWELSLHPDGLCTIAEGEHAGKPLRDLIEGDFPTLIKLIDAESDLSIQVHPAKTEMWIILDCEEGAQLVYGLNRPFDEGEVRAALERGEAESLLRYVPVHRGDVFFIPSGLVHAIGKGILIAEIQQNSNVTYRVYDYGRLQGGKPRELHIEQALAVIRDFNEEQIQAIRFSTHPRSGEEELAACPYFNTFRLEIEGNRTLPQRNSWQCLLCTEGEGTIDGMHMRAGDTFFALPEAGELTVSSQNRMTVLLTTV